MSGVNKCRLFVALGRSMQRTKMIFKTNGNIHANVPCIPETNYSSLLMSYLCTYIVYYGLSIAYSFIRHYKADLPMLCHNGCYLLYYTAMWCKIVDNFAWWLSEIVAKIIDVCGHNKGEQILNSADNAHDDVHSGWDKLGQQVVLIEMVRYDKRTLCCRTVQIPSPLGGTSIFDKLWGVLRIFSRPVFSAPPPPYLFTFGRFQAILGYIFKDVQLHSKIILQYNPSTI